MVFRAKKTSKPQSKPRHKIDWAKTLDIIKAVLAVATLVIAIIKDTRTPPADFTPTVPPVIESIPPVAVEPEEKEVNSNTRKRVPRRKVNPLNKRGNDARNPLPR